MKRRYILVACLAATLRAQAQDIPASGFGPQQSLTTPASGASSVYAADLDGDGDLDVLSASGIYSYPYQNSNIAWYENQGDGSFVEQQVISRDVLAPYSVYAADLDQDGDMDVLSASNWDDKIAWYENLMGEEAMPVIQSFTLVNAATDEEIQEIQEGDVIDLATLSSTKFSIEAITEPSVVGSVAFRLTGPFIHGHTENHAPYTLFGDKPAGDFSGRLLPPGEYTLVPGQINL